jgi:ABC-2 type transport system ATP-binding protein
VDSEGFKSVILTTDKDNEMGEVLLKALINAHYRVRSLNRQRPTLEDVFLAATRRSWDVIDTK